MILPSPGLDLFWQAGHESSGGVGLGFCVGLREKSATDPNLEEQIRCRAYELYEQRDQEDGDDVDDWLRTEAEIIGTNLRTAA